MCLLSLMSYAQSNTLSAGGQTIKEYPKFKGIAYQIAISEYINSKYENFNNTSDTYASHYSPVIAFTFKSDGSLADAYIVKTTGSKNFDDKLLKLCKDFTKKKFMSPAFSAEGPVPCTVEVEFDFRYFKMDPINEGLGYRESYYTGYIPNSSGRKYGNASSRRY